MRATVDRKKTRGHTSIATGQHLRPGIGHNPFLLRNADMDISFRVPNISQSSQGGSDAPRIDRGIRNDVVDLAARNADVLELPVIQTAQIGA
jgi:hypothetical protein